MSPKIKNLELAYIIGEQNEAIQLKKYYNLPLMNTHYTVSFSFEQIGGYTIPSAIIDNLGSFDLRFNDTNAVGNSSVFKITADTDLSDQVPNSQLIIKFNLKIKERSEVKSFNFS